MKMIRVLEEQLGLSCSAKELDDSPLVSFPVVEVFHSVQGEGFWTGTNALFIRLAGCDVGCQWCDTKESWSMRQHPQHSVDKLVAAVQEVMPKIVVITGGEPLMHDLTPLTDRIHSTDVSIHLETSGAHPFSGNFDWVTLSPKISKPVHSSVYSHVNELKVVVVSPSDLERAEQEGEQVSSEVVKCLQPEWNTPGSYNLIFDYILRHPEWRISLQTHKFSGVR
jgi:7-carboxy-7-deazaguanine synthase